MHSRLETLEAFGRVFDILLTLRERCPWDRKQTNESLRPNTVEEVYELCDALTRGEASEVRKELGDVLMHVVFYAIFASEKGSFDLADVCESLAEKLIFRHPHIYGEQQQAGSATTAGQVEANWERIKQREKGGNRSVLSGVPASLPTLIKAYRIQDKARNVGFDWTKREEVWNKVREELGEFEAELRRSDSDEEQLRQSREAELGDLLFSLVNAARLYGLNPDNALNSTCLKFISRFNFIEAEARRQGRDLGQMSIEEMDSLWDAAKRSGL